GQRGGGECAGGVGESDRGGEGAGEHPEVGVGGAGAQHKGHQGFHRGAARVGGDGELGIDRLESAAQRDGEVAGGLRGRGGDPAEVDVPQHIQRLHGDQTGGGEVLGEPHEVQQGRRNGG